MAVVAVFSLVIFFWAMRVALPPERIEQMIGEVVLPEEAGAASAADQALTRER